VKRENRLNANIEIAVTGVQNRRILSGLLLRRLAAKNKAKNAMAKIQNKGEIRLSKNTPGTTAIPVALELLIPRRAKINPGPSRATNIAASPLKTFRRVVTVRLRDRYVPYSTQRECP